MGLDGVGDGIMAAFLVPILVFVSVTAIGGAVLSARAARRRPLQARLASQYGQLGESAAPGGKTHLRRALERLAVMVSIGRPSSRLQEDLTKAGYHASNAAKLYLGAKVLLFIIGAAGLAVVPLPTGMSLSVRVFLILAGATVLSLVPNFVLYRRRTKRAEEIRRHLPDALDLLEICVSSGMGLDAAWNAVADEVRRVSTTLGDEMALTNLELHLGSPRAVAMRRMAERTGADEISSLVGVLVQSDRFGTSIRDALRTFAGSMREERSQQAAEDAEKMAVKLLFPLVLFIFPTVLVVGIGPAAIKLAEFFGGQ